MTTIPIPRPSPGNCARSWDRGRDFLRSSRASSPNPPQAGPPIRRAAAGDPVIPALQFGSVEVARKHAGRRIPMSAFVERYIDGSIDVDGDLQRFLRGCDGIINYRLTM